jgi:hypothetical protein
MTVDLFRNCFRYAKNSIASFVALCARKGNALM